MHAVSSELPAFAHLTECAGEEWALIVALEILRWTRRNELERGLVCSRLCL